MSLIVPFFRTRPQSATGPTIIGFGDALMVREVRWWGKFIIGTIQGPIFVPRGVVSMRTGRIVTGIDMYGLEATLSWSGLDCEDSTFTVLHNDGIVVLPECPASERLFAI